MAPEVLLRRPHSPASDVYAWAVLVNELAAGVVPFSDCVKENPACHTVLEMGYGHQELAAAVAAAGLRPLVPDAVPPALRDVLDACWARDPAARPPAAWVAERMREAERALGSAAETVPGDGGDDRASLDGGAGPRPAWPPGCPAAGPPGCPAAGPPGSPAADPPGSPEGDPALPWPRPAWARDGGHAPAVKAGAFAARGPRDEMEDRHVVAHRLGGRAGAHLAAVFDGHRGAACAEHARRRLLAHLRAAWEGAAGGTAQGALAGAFRAVDEEFRRESDVAWAARVARMGAAAAGPRGHPGATAVAALVEGGDLYVANAGDCRAVLSRAGGAVVALSRDHHAGDPGERARVAAAGGAVRAAADGYRVGAAGLQVTRSLGDADAKAEGVTAEPEVTHTALAEGDEFLLLASDGVWEVLSNEEAVGLVHDTVKDPYLCGKRVATEALARGSRDNVTVAVVFLAEVSTLERVYDAATGEKYRFQGTFHGTRSWLDGLARGACADERADVAL